MSRTYEDIKEEKNALFHQLLGAMDVQMSLMDAGVDVSWVHVRSIIEEINKLCAEASATIATVTA